MFKRLILTVGSILFMTAAAATANNAQASDPENTIFMRVSTGGTVTIELKPDLAPTHVERIKELTRQGFYDGLVFHRVIDGFMAQTGDPTGTGTGGSDLPDLKAEFTEYPYKRGTIGMARTSNPDSANSQFFICFSDDGCSFLTGQYTVWGQVTEGMELIDRVAKGEPPASPDRIEKMFVAVDVLPQKADTAQDPVPEAPIGLSTESPAETEAEAEASSATQTIEKNIEAAVDSAQPETHQDPSATPDAQAEPQDDDPTAATAQ